VFAWLAGPSAAAAVEIEYWQYIFDSRVKAMDTLIKTFEAKNPGITVKQTTFPYADYQTKVAAAVSAGVGPDVVQLYYGWLDKFLTGHLLQPLSQSTFAPAEIEKAYFPAVTAMKRDGVYYGLPTAVRSLALFYNKTIFAEAGIARPPKTLSELVDVATRTTKRDAGGNLVSVGLAVDTSKQDAQWWREVLVRQFGGKPYSDDNRTVTYADAAGAAALGFYTDLQLKHKVAQQGFMDDGPAAFRAGRAAMIVDGSFGLGNYATIKGFEWAVAELPASDSGVKGNYISYWANAITRTTKGEKLAAAEKFLAYINSPEAMQVWLDIAGELPARREVAFTAANLAHPLYGPFLASFEAATVTQFVDETAQRQAVIDMVNRVVLEGMAPKDALARAAKQEQTLLDRQARR
jgi:multiple sugar transport system substrate-binding protein